MIIMAKENQYAYKSDKPVPTPPEPKYKKAEEQVKSDYESAVKLADEIYAQYASSPSADGSRTSEEAKVRIRRRSDDTFRVVLYKKIGEKKKEKDSSEEKPDKRPKQKGNKKRGRQKKARKVTKSS